MTGTANTINLASSTSGDVITSQGTGNPAIGVASKTVGGLVWLASYAPSGVASIDVTSVISSIYAAYRVIISNFIATTSAKNLLVQYSTNNGSTWDTTAAHYSWAYIASTLAASPVVVTKDSVSDTGINLVQSLSNSINSSIILDIINPSSAIQVSSVWYGLCANSTPAYEYLWGTGIYEQGAAINAFQLIMSSGNITSATVKVYGYLGS